MKRQGPRRDTEKRRWWRDAIRQQRHSGQCVREYCRENGLSEPSFYAWRRELRRRGRQKANGGSRRVVRARSGGGREALVGEGRPAFVSVQVAPGAVPVGGAWIECLLPGGVVLRLPANMEPAAIAAVLRSWEKWSC